MTKLTQTTDTSKMPPTVEYNGVKAADLHAVKPLPQIHVLQFYYPANNEAAFFTQIGDAVKFSKYLTAIFTVKPKQLTLLTQS